MEGSSARLGGAGGRGSTLAHPAGFAGGTTTIARRDPAKAERLGQVYEGRGIDLASGADLAPRTAAVAVALAGPWHELTVPAGGLPPIADISAPSAIPALIRAGLNGGFLGIDDLFVRAEAVPGAYTDSAVRVVAAKTREYMRWLG